MIIRPKLAGRQKLKEGFNMSSKAFEMADEIRSACTKAADELLQWTKGNKSAGRRARKLLDQIAKDKVALRKAMIHADRNQ